MRSKKEIGVENTARQTALEVVGDSDFEILELTFRREKTGRVLRILLERTDGEDISLDDCADFSRRLSLLLDEKDFIPYDSYSLEVSSPGLDRPLKKPGDFLRFTGRLANIVTREADSTGRRKYKGRIKSAGDEVFTVFVEEENNEFDIKYSNVKKAHLEIEL